jgi:hypothetical protein
MLLAVPKPQKATPNLAIIRMQHMPELRFRLLQSCTPTASLNRKSTLAVRHTKILSADALKQSTGLAHLRSPITTILVSTPIRHHCWCAHWFWLLVWSTLFLWSLLLISLFETGRINQPPTNASDTRDEASSLVAFVMWFIRLVFFCFASHRIAQQFCSLGFRQR